MFKNILFCAAGILVAGQKGKLAQAQGQGKDGQGMQGQGMQGQGMQAQSSGEIVGGGIISHHPTPAAAGAFLDASDAILLLLDHQTGLFQTVKDVPLPELRNNVVAMVNIAQLAEIPVISTASEPNGPNGPLFEELAALNTTFVPRKGEISAWENADFVAAVESTGKKTLIMAGVWTSVCVAFPALQAKLDGYKVYAVWDASGDMSEMASRVTLARLTQAGVIPVTTNVILGEIQRTWNRPDAATWGALYSELVPNYKAVAESFARAQKGAQPMNGQSMNGQPMNGQPSNGQPMNGQPMNGQPSNGKRG